MLKRILFLALPLLLLAGVCDARDWKDPRERVNARVWGPDSDPYWIWGTDATSGESVYTKLKGNDAPIFAIDVRKQQEYPRKLRGKGASTRNSTAYYLAASGVYREAEGA